MKNLLLVIDPQNDFVEPSGSLAVNGALADMERLIGFIGEEGHGIADIVLTLDSHNPIHIASPAYWQDAVSAHPAPFTMISAYDVRSGRFMPRYNEAEALPYLEALEASGKRHIIWPPHCLYGTSGWAVYAPLYSALEAWSLKKGKDLVFYTKGLHSGKTEMFSVVKPEVSFDEADAERAEDFLSLLAGYDKIFVAGEAENFCVRNSVADIVSMRPELTEKLVILKQCMSLIPLEGDDTADFWKNLEEQGAKMAR